MEVKKILNNQSNPREKTTVWVAPPNLNSIHATESQQQKSWHKNISIDGTE